MITPQVQDSIDRSVLCWLATASADGRPSVSPKEMFTSHGSNSIIIANIASPNSARNIRANPYACVSFVDIFTQRGYQVTGRARYVTSADPEFPDLAPPLREMAGDAFPFKSLFKVTAEHIAEIVAPRYRLYPETTAKQQIDSAMRTYNVQPRSDP